MKSTQRVSLSTGSKAMPLVCHPPNLRPSGLDLRLPALCLPLVVLLLAGPLLAQNAPTRLVLRGARVLHPSCKNWREGFEVWIAGNRIENISPSSPVAVPKGIRVVDLKGLSLVPGLIDLHSHLLLHPYDEASWSDQVLRESLELRTIRGVAAAKATLDAGFTTLRDLGTEGAGFADVGLRDAIDQGIIPGPRIFAVTRAIVATGCYGPSGFDPRWDVPKGAQVADGVNGVRKAVRQQIAAGADWIKVYADYRRRPGDPSTPTFSVEELRAIVDEARSAGLPVSAHAVTNEAIRRAVVAGVATIEHGNQASAGILAMMKENDVVLVPTLAASDAMARYGGWSPGMDIPARIMESRRMFAAALRVGVTIACGSDVGVFAHGDNVRELELMVEYGMSQADALRSATVTAAEVLGRGKDLGRIERDYLADLIAVRGDPLIDPFALRSVVLVIKDGRIVVDRR